MKKQSYMAPELNITIFGNEDVITASTPNYIPDRDDPIELPFIPVP